MKFVKVGNLVLALPAFLLAVVGIIAGTFSIAADPSSAILGLFLTGMFFVQAYTVNCLIVGRCDAWAWVLAVAFVSLLAAWHLSFTFPVVSVTVARNGSGA